jgi:hypothetical protein
MSKTLRLKFTDFPGPTNPNALRHLLAKDFELVPADDSPDVVIFSVFGNEHLRHGDALKIFFTGENVHADLNLCDYAFGFDWMEIEDRYYRSPNFVLYREFEQLLDSAAAARPALDAYRARPRFCNFIYSNSKAHPIRDQIFHMLSKYHQVDSAGPHLNTCGFNVGSPSLGDQARVEKIRFQKECRFTLAVENSSSPGYTTEKLVHALLAGTIPIYWGDSAVARQFNPQRFINVHAYSTLEEVVQRVREVDQDPSEQQAILAEPVFVSEEAKWALSKETLRSRLKGILEQDLETAKRRNRHVWGKIYEERRREETRRLGRLARWADRLERKLRPT